MRLNIRLLNGGFGAERFVASLLALTSFGSYNTGYTAHSVRPNSAFGGTSYSPNMLGETRYKTLTNLTKGGREWA